MEKIVESWFKFYINEMMENKDYPNAKKEYQMKAYAVAQILDEVSGNDLKSREVTELFYK